MTDQRLLDSIALVEDLLKANDNCERDRTLQDLHRVLVWVRDNDIPIKAVDSVVKMFPGAIVDYQELEECQDD